MNSADLIDELARVCQLTKQESETIVSCVFDSLTGALARGDKVEIRGLGSFRIRQRRARNGRNPKTGAVVSVPAKKVAFFRAGRRLANLMNA